MNKRKEDIMADLKELLGEALQKAIKADLLKDMPTPPAGNQTTIDYSKQIAEAQASGDMALMASLIRQQAAASAVKH
ncbi:hypothetical protein [Roseburia inulinivorans]